MSLRKWMGRHTGAHGLQVRFPQACDLPALMSLEQSKWEVQRAASEAMLLQRIETFPQLNCAS